MVATIRLSTGSRHEDFESGHGLLVKEIGGLQCVQCLGCERNRILSRVDVAHALRVSAVEDGGRKLGCALESGSSCYRGKGVGSIARAIASAGNDVTGRSLQDRERQGFESLRRDGVV